LYFNADSGNNKGYELYAYNGLTAPWMDKDIAVGTNSSDPRYMKVFNSKLYLSADIGDGAGRELWVYDGINATRAADINPSGSSEISYLQVLNNMLYFNAYGGDGKGSELWAYDGSHAPYRVADIYPNNPSSYPAYLEVFKNKLYFQADNGAGAGVELWVFDPSVIKTFSSTAANDGWLLESTRTSSKGGTLNKTAATLSVGDDAKNRQYRAILHFNTATLPDNAVINSAKLQVRHASIKGTNPFNTHGALYVDLRKGAFSNNNALQLVDWQAPASKPAAGKIPKTSASWHTLNLVYANLSYINKKGMTQFRLRFAKQDNGDNGADYVNFYSGNCTTTANRPKLVVTYYVP